MGREFAAFPGVLLSLPLFLYQDFFLSELFFSA